MSKYEQMTCPHNGGESRFVGDVNYFGTSLQPTVLVSLLIMTFTFFAVTSNWFHSYFIK